LVTSYKTLLNIEPVVACVDPVVPEVVPLVPDVPVVPVVPVVPLVVDPDVEPEVVLLAAPVVAVELPTKQSLLQYEPPQHEVSKHEESSIPLKN
jgi:hypothetical protein